MLDANNYLGKMLAERYRLVRVIGKGASSLVFYAEDMMMRREDGSPLPVAVKILDTDAGGYKLNSKSFRTEIQAVANIPTNPHMVAVKDVSFREDEHFIVMEYVSGKTLKEYIGEKGGVLPPKEIVSISLQLLQALRHAHEVNVVHRDIKPENIMVERRDAVGKQVEIPGGAEMPFVKLADFGIALLPDEDLFAMKDKGVGTVRYISPEQASGAPVDARGDLYSLGVVMYEMATGHVPFDAGSATGIISKHQTEMPLHVRGDNTSIPAALDEVIFTAMQKNPASRYKDALTMERKLREVLKKLAPETETVGDVFDFGSAAVSFESEPEAPKKKAPVKEKKPSSGKGAKIALISALSAFLVALLVLGAVFLLPLLGEDTMDIKIPNLIGTVYDPDGTYADGIHVPADKIVYEYSNDVEAGKIIDQSPASGVILHEVTGAEVILTVSLGPEMTEFSIPEAYRASEKLLKEYLRANYPLVTVQFVRPAAAAKDGVYAGTVLGAYRVRDAEEPLSLDGGEVYKSKVEKIVIEVQPNVTVPVTLALDVLTTAESAGAYLTARYPFLTVSGTAVEREDPNTLMPAGTVIGVRLADGTEHFLSMIGTTQDISFDAVYAPQSVVLLTATGELPMP